jgi:pyruvate dehydrogenase E1 component alpha subunit
MHIADQDTGNLGANAIVGGSAGIATGAAMSAKMRGSQQVAVCFFGDGALGQGLLYETMNMASLWKLPVIYVCENNQYTVYELPRDDGRRKWRHAEAFGHTATIDGQDVQLVHATSLALVERARLGEGPAFLQCNTYRFYGHHVGDIDRSYYRAKNEEEEWKSKRDPVKLFAEWLKERDGGWLLDQIQMKLKRNPRGGAVCPRCPVSGPDEVGTCICVNQRQWALFALPMDWESLFPSPIPMGEAPHLYPLPQRGRGRIMSRDRQ